MMDLLKMKSFSAVKIVSGISGSHIISFVNLTMAEVRQLLFILPKINGYWGTSATVIPFPEQFHFFSSVICVPIC